MDEIAGIQRGEALNSSIFLSNVLISDEFPGRREVVSVFLLVSNDVARIDPGPGGEQPGSSLGAPQLPLQPAAPPSCLV